jgi:hypothetical protein
VYITVWSLQDHKQYVQVPDEMCLTDDEIVEVITKDRLRGKPIDFNYEWSANDESGDYHQPIMISREGDDEDETIWEHPILGREIRDNEVLLGRGNIRHELAIIYARLDQLADLAPSIRVGVPLLDAMQQIAIAREVLESLEQKI